MGWLLRYWGFLIFIITIAGWVTGDIVTPVLLILSVVSAGYFAFGAPLWCGAVTRDGMLCRNNCSGLLMGCHLRQHRWQKLKMAVIPRSWRELNKGLWSTPRTGVTTLGGLGSAVSGLAAVAVIVLHH